MKYFLILIFLPFKLYSQDISGVWTGYLYNDTTKQKIQYELAISDFNGKPTGYSHTIFVIDSIKNIGVKSVSIKEKGGHFYIVDDKLVFNNYPEPPPKGVKQFSFLTLSENDTSDVLSGIWRTNATRIFRPLTGSIFLEKKKKVEETLIVNKLTQLGLVDKLSFVTPAMASRLIALNNKPVAPVKNPALVAKNTKAKVEAPIAKEEITPVKEEKVVAISEKKVETPTITPEKKPVILIEKKKTTPPSVIKEPKPVVKETPPAPKVVVAEKKKIEKPVAVVPQPPKQVEKKTIEKQMPEPTHQGDNNIVIVAPPKEEKKSIESPAATELAKRSIETIRTVEIVRDSLVFSLYDNGAVDGDTVSVLVNGKVVMPRVGLTERANNKTIYLTPDMGDSISVIMYAENLGSIPPNTGLLVIREGEKIYEIRFSGDLNKNSKIILVRKREE